MDDAMNEVVAKLETAARRIAHLKAPRGKTLAKVERILKGESK